MQVEVIDGARYMCAVDRTDTASDLINIIPIPTLPALHFMIYGLKHDTQHSQSQLSEKSMDGFIGSITLIRKVRL